MGRFEEVRMVLSLNLVPGQVDLCKETPVPQLIRRRETHRHKSSFFRGSRAFYFLLLMVFSLNVLAASGAVTFFVLSRLR